MSAAVGVRGFTLVEVLVAVLVFGILAASAYVALDGLSAAAGDHRRHADRLAGLQRTVAMIDADLRQLVSRPVRENGSLSPALAGTRTGFAATRAGDFDVHGQSRLRRVGWQSETDGLVRVRRADLDSAPDEPWVRARVPEPVRGLRLRYRDRTGAWHERWPAETGGPGSLPVAVEYELDLAESGRLRRLVVLQ